MLFVVGILFVAAWAVGMVATPHVGWYQHVPLLFGILAIGYRVLRPARARP